MKNLLGKPNGVMTGRVSGFSPKYPIVDLVVVVVVPVYFLHGLIILTSPAPDMNDVSISPTHTLQDASFSCRFFFKMKSLFI